MGWSRSASTKRAGPAFLLASVLLTTGLAVAGRLQGRNAPARHRAALTRDLSALVGLSAGDLAQPREYRRADGSVVLLYERSFETPDPLRPRPPLARARLPEAQVALEHGRGAAGEERRCVPVVTAWRPVHDPSWALVARPEPAITPARRGDWWGQAAILASLLLNGTVAWLALTWRRQRNQLRRGQAVSDVSATVAGPGVICLPWSPSQSLRIPRRRRRPCGSRWPQPRPSTRGRPREEW